MKFQNVRVHQRFIKVQDTSIKVYQRIYTRKLRNEFVNAQAVGSYNEYAWVDNETEVELI